MELKAMLKKYFSLLILAFAFLASLITVLCRRVENFPPGVTVIRIGHWQLESGVKDGLNLMAQEYEKLHPNVRIVQEAIPEGVYDQWLSTQFMGGTTPDIVQMGKLPYQQLVAYYNRYCLPLTGYVNQPNGYNAGNELEDVTWRQTFKDGMRSCYVNELQEFMAVPLSQTLTRVFYNKELLKKLSGLDRAPRSYREFYEACRKIRERKNGKGQDYIPIVGSLYHFGMWIEALCNPLTYPLFYKADYNYDGYVSSEELFIAVKSGTLSFQSRPIAARFRMIRELADFCQPGFTGVARDDGVFLFAQQRAVFISTGTWDAKSLIDQAKGHFSVGMMDFPYPGKDDPEYGDIVYGPRYESPGQAFIFAVTRTGKAPEVAIDFLRFLSSRKQNEELNRIICWIPAVSGAKVSDFFQGFEPNLHGTYANFNTWLGGESWLKWEQLTSLYNVNQISYSDFAREFESCYKSRGMADYEEVRRDWRRGVRNNERLWSAMRFQAMRKTDPDDPLWRSYRSQYMNNLLFPEINRIAQRKKMLQPEAFVSDSGPYEYTLVVREKIKERLNLEMTRKER